MAEDVKVKNGKQCLLDVNGCVTLKNILIAFNAPINEEHAWALCYQCSKCFKNSIRNEWSRCFLVSELDHILLHRDGQVHHSTIFAGGGTQGQCFLYFSPHFKRKMLFLKVANKFLNLLLFFDELLQLFVKGGFAHYFYKKKRKKKEYTKQIELLKTII